MCASTEYTLHVHHAYYDKGREPWEYDVLTLHCVCEHCHELASDVDRDWNYAGAFG